jgi:hypothetical protein
MHIVNHKLNEVRAAAGTEGVANTERDEKRESQVDA